MENTTKKKRGGRREGSGRKKIYSDLKDRKYKKNISCNVTEEEYNIIKQHAEKEGLTVYALVKQAVFTYLKDKRYWDKEGNL